MIMLWFTSPSSTWVYTYVVNQYLHGICNYSSSFPSPHIQIQRASLFQSFSHSSWFNTGSGPKPAIKKRLSRFRHRRTSRTLTQLSFEYFDSILPNQVRHFRSTITFYGNHHKSIRKMSSPRRRIETDVSAACCWLFVLWGPARTDCDSLCAGYEVGFKRHK